MKSWIIIALCLVACTTQPTAPAPVASASASASPPQAASSSPEPSPAAPSASAAASRAPEPTFVALSSTEWAATLPGRWIGADKGDAIPDGPTGGKIVQGGARVAFVRSRRGSKTPWNVVFWLPAPGHMSATSISGGCGFYPSGTAFCRGYQEVKLVDLNDVARELRHESQKTTISFETSDAGRLRMKIPMSESAISVELVRAK